MSGDDKGAISLDSLSTLPNLYALGPVAGLNGEITVFNSEPSIATIRDGQPVVEKTFHVEAPLLIYAQVAKWSEVPIPGPVHTVPDLESFVASRAKKAGIDMTAPFPFRVTAHCDQVAMHIVNRQGREVKGHEDHSKIQVKIPLTDADVELIGFWSDRQQMVLTHMGSNTHIHGRTVDGKVSGHVDDLRIHSGKLFLPVE
jgi:acetolactate decarboxylase